MTESFDTSFLCVSYSHLIHAYIEAQLENRENLEQFEELHDHLEYCSHCSRFYRAWYETMRRASEDALPAANLHLTQDIALNALARLSDRPSIAGARQKRPSPFDRFAYRSPYFFSSRAFEYLLRRAASATITVLLVTFGIWLLLIWNDTNSIELNWSGTSWTDTSSSSSTHPLYQSLSLHTMSAVEAPMTSTQGTPDETTLLSSRSPLAVPSPLNREVEEGSPSAPVSKWFCPFVQWQRIISFDGSCPLPAQ